MNPRAERGDYYRRVPRARQAPTLHRERLRHTHAGA